MVGVSFLRRVERQLDAADAAAVKRALEVATQCHEGQTRATGEEYIYHPLAVAEIVLDLQADKTLLCAALLHDCEEDSPGSITAIEKEFGEEVANIVRGLTKLDQVQASGAERQQKSLRKMLLAMSGDVRIMLIKLADRLHNMQTLEHMPKRKQLRTARETLSIYAPIASRLGIYKMKVPLEDLSFFYLYPEEYHELSRQMLRLEAHRDRIVRGARGQLEALLKESEVKGKVVGRVKHLWSIYKKMHEKQAESIDELNDVFALRIVVPDMTSCYAMLGEIHKGYTPLKNRIKDYIAVPKANGYQSLHTTVLGLAGIKNKAIPIEVQIRTPEMDQQAEYGVAAHWAYKDGASQVTEWLGDIGEEQEHTDASEWEHQLHQDELQKRIYALTPRGDVKDLPKGATPIDFGFAVHTDLGMKMKGAKVNGKQVPIGRPLENGDVIEVTSSKTIQVSTNWMRQCVSSKARQKIRSYLQEKSADELMRQGRSNINVQLGKRGMEELDENATLLRDYGKGKLTKGERDDVLKNVGNGSLSAQVLVRQLLGEVSTRPKYDHVHEEADRAAEAGEHPEIVVAGQLGMPTRYPQCCRPKPGRRILGYTTRTNVLTIHERDCKTALSLDQRRVLPAWYEGERPVLQVRFNVVQESDRTGVLYDVLNIFRDYRVNITGLKSTVAAERPEIVVDCELQRHELVDEIVRGVELIDVVGEVRVEMS